MTRVSELSRFISARQIESSFTLNRFCSFFALLCVLESSASVRFFPLQRAYARRHFHLPERARSFRTATLFQFKSAAAHLHKS
jgi:hypothetical protein